MLPMLIQAYCVNVVVDIKPIYLNKLYLLKNNIYYLDKSYFSFAKRRKAFQTYSVSIKLVNRLVKNIDFMEPSIKMRHVLQ